MARLRYRVGAGGASPGRAGLVSAAGGVPATSRRLSSSPSKHRCRVGGSEDRNSCPAATFPTEDSSSSPGPPAREQELGPPHGQNPASLNLLCVRVTTLGTEDSKVRGHGLLPDQAGGVYVRERQGDRRGGRPGEKGTSLTRWPRAPKSQPAAALPADAPLAGMCVRGRNHPPPTFWSHGPTPPAWPPSPRAPVHGLPGSVSSHRPQPHGLP